MRRQPQQLGESGGSELCALSNGFCEKSYECRCVHGLKVWIDRTCNSEEVTSCLQEDIELLSQRMPSPVWQQLLKKTRLWVNSSFSYRGDQGEAIRGQGSCAHCSKEWLSSHGNLPEKAGCVEVYEWEHYKTWNLSRAGTLAHELAHIYHFLLGRDQPDIRQAFDEALAAGKYEAVPHCSGRTLRAYALTNDTEFFASLSVPYFGLRNDYYPFTLEELTEFDPTSLGMLNKVWGLASQPSQPSQSEVCCLGLMRWSRRAQPAPRAPRHAMTACRRISPAGRAACSLDVEGSGQWPMVRARGHFSGMMWFVDPSDEEGEPGYCRLTTQFTGPHVCLDLTNPARDPVMRPRGQVAGQYWQLRKVAEGHYVLSCKWLGPDMVLSYSIDPNGEDSLRMCSERTEGRAAAWLVDDYTE